MNQVTKPTPRGCEANNHTHPVNRVDSPIAYRVAREGETVAICTACLREGDKIVELVASFEMNGYDYEKHDMLGFILLTIALSAAANASNGPIH